MASRPELDLRNPWIAAGLAYLVPGAGHLYQRRYAKSTIFFCGIMGLFLCGTLLGEGKVVYWRWEPGVHRTIGYYSQFLVGLAALPARLQAMRYESPPFANALPDDPVRRDTTDSLEVGERISSDFRGRFQYIDSSSSESAESPIDDVTGSIELERVTGKFGVSEVKGTLKIDRPDGTVQTLDLSGRPVVGYRVFSFGEVTYQELVRPEDEDRREFSGRRRFLRCQFHTTDHKREGTIEGTVARSTWNWFQVPVEEKALRWLHGTLGRRYELAHVFTWIAGLLNLLAVWDALDGPAYGMGDEDEEEDEEEDGDGSAEAGD